MISGTIFKKLIGTKLRFILLQKTKIPLRYIGGGFAILIYTY